MTHKRRRSPSIAVAFVVALLAASCSSDSPEDDTESAPTTASSTTTETPDDPDADDTESDDTESEEPADEASALEGFDAVTATVEAFVEAEGLNGAGLVVVDADDGVVYEEYFGEFSPDRVSMIASSSKMISAGVLLSLQDDGLLDMDAPIEGFIDWAIGNPDITPAQLVSNSSGLVGLGPDLFYPPYLCQWSPDSTLQACGEGVFTSAADDGDQLTPDTEFRYGGAQWQVAGAVAEAVSGRSWQELVDEIFVEPCGVDSLGYLSLGAVPPGPDGYPEAFAGDPESVPPTDNPNIEGGAYIDAGDYATLLLMNLRGGMCGDEQVLSQAALDTMHTDRLAAAYDGDAGDADTGYGMGWWVSRETGRISDPGAWGAVPWLDLDDGYGAYLIIENQSDTGQDLARQIEDLVHTAVVDG